GVQTCALPISHLRDPAIPAAETRLTPQAGTGSGALSAAAARAPIVTGRLATMPAESCAISSTPSTTRGTSQPPVRACTAPRAKGPRPARRYPNPCAIVDRCPVWCVSGERHTMYVSDRLIEAPCPSPITVIHTQVPLVGARARPRYAAAVS